MSVFLLRSGLKVEELSNRDLVGRIQRSLQEGRPFRICTVNPEIAELCRHDSEYRRCVEKSDARTIDGVGIALAVLAHHQRLPRRMTGVELTWVLARWARSQGREVLIIGASEISRRRAEERLGSLGLAVRRGCSPQVSARGESDEPLQALLPSGGLVLVALGAPKQELLIERLIEGGGAASVYVGVGGAVDYLSGIAREPPWFVRRIGLEWVFRLTADHRGRWARQVRSLPPFLLREVLSR